MHVQLVGFSSLDILYFPVKRMSLDSYFVFSFPFSDDVSPKKRQHFNFSKPFVTICMITMWLQWALMTVLDPLRSLANLMYIGYSGDPSSALCVNRRRTIDRKKQRTERNVFQCFVFGPKNAGKSTLLNSFLERYCFLSRLL